MRLGKTTIVHFGGQAVVSLAGFGATFAIAVLEGSSFLGRYAIAVALGSFLLLVPMQALSQGVRKRISERQEPAAYLGVGVLVNAVLVVFLAVLVLAAAAALRAVELPDAEFVTVLTTYDTEIVGLLVGATAFQTVRDALEGSKRVGSSGLLMAAERLSRTSLQVALLLAGYGLAALITGHGLTLLVGAVVGMALLGIRIEFPSASHVWSVYEYARYAWLGTLRTRVFGWLDTFILSFFVSASLVGIYEAAWGIAALLGIMSLAIRRTLFPEVSDLSARDDYTRIRSILEDGLAFSGVFAIPGLFGAAVIGQRILRFYRPEFEQGAGILLLLITAYVVESYGAQFVSVINAIDLPSIAYRINLLFIVASVVLTTSLTWAFGWYGAALGTASASAFRGLLGYRVLVREIDAVPLPVGDVGRQVLAAGIMAVVVSPVNTVIPRGRPGTLLVVGIGATVYLGCLLVLSDTVRRKTLTLLPVARR